MGLLKWYMDWRMARATESKCTACATTNFVSLGADNLVKLRHETCEYGVLKPGGLISIVGGTYRWTVPASLTFHNSKGFYIGTGTWVRETDSYIFTPPSETPPQPDQKTDKPAHTAESPPPGT